MTAVRFSPIARLALPDRARRARIVVKQNGATPSLEARAWVRRLSDAGAALRPNGDSACLQSTTATCETAWEWRLGPGAQRLEDDLLGEVFGFVSLTCPPVRIEKECLQQLGGEERLAMGKVGLSGPTGFTKFSPSSPGIARQDGLVGYLFNRIVAESSSQVRRYMSKIRMKLLFS